MQELLIAIGVAFLGGISAGTQGPLVNIVGQRLGILESIFVVHFGGALASGFLLLCLQGGNLGGWRHVPKYAMGCGFLGLLVISAIVYCVPRLGLAATTTIFVAAQLSLGLLFDHYGLLELSIREISTQRIAGILVLFLGIFLIVK